MKVVVSWYLRQLQRLQGKSDSENAPPNNKLPPIKISQHELGVNFPQGYHDIGLTLPSHETISINSDQYTTATMAHIHDLPNEILQMIIRRLHAMSDNDPFALSLRHLAAAPPHLFDMTFEIYYIHTVHHAHHSVPHGLEGRRDYYRSIWERRMSLRDKWNQRHGSAALGVDDGVGVIEVNAGKQVLKELEGCSKELSFHLQESESHEEAS